MRNVASIRKISNSVIVFAEDMFVRDLLEISLWRGMVSVVKKKKATETEFFIAIERRNGPTTGWSEPTRLIH